MFKLFAKSAQSSVIVADKKQATNEVIKEIHESFYTEVDKLLASANISHSLDTDKQALIDKCNVLKSLGFTSTKEVVDAEKEISRLEKLKADNESKKELIEAINHFRFKYPNYKFITEESVKKICDKYNLIYGPVDKYIGTVPDKNLKHIQEFKIQDEDSCWIEEDLFFGGFGMGERILNTKFKSTKKAKEDAYAAMERFRTEPLQAMQFRSRTSQVIVRGEECRLEIAAPEKDFDKTGMELDVKTRKLTKIEVPDPIVLKPVVFNGKKHYLIVTAWGIEASDESVVNHINN